MNLFATTTAVRASRKRTFSWRGGAAARFLSGVAILALCAAPASAGVFTFDSDSNGANGATDGGGSWNTTAVNWYNGTTDVVWPNTLSDTAIFGNGGAGGTVNVIFPGGSTPVINVGTIQFGTATTGYTIAAGPITLGTGIVNNNGTVSSTISSVIAGTNGLAYSGTGTGTVTLSGANTYTGITTLSSGGTLGMGNATGFGSTAGATASALGTNYTVVNSGTTAKVATTAEAFLINGTGVASAGALRISNSNTTLSSLIQLGSTSTIAGAFSNGNTISGNIDLSTFTLTFSNTAGTISGQIVSTGGGGSVNFGSNSFTLTNNSNNYAGTTTINGGTLTLGGDTVLGTSGFAMSGGGVQSIDGTTRNIANAVTGFGTLTFGATSVNTGALNFTNTTATNFGFNPKTLTTNVNTSFAGALTLGAGSLTKAGAATLTLAGNNTYQGGTTISAGTLQLGNGGTTGGLLATTAIVDNGNLTINRSNAAVQGTDFSTAAITGTGSFTQAGTGTTTLMAANTYSGGTTVSAGELRLANTTGSGTGSGIVTLTGGAVSGTGTSSGALTATGGSILAPGNNTASNVGTVGTLGVGTTGGASLTNAALDFDFSSSGLSGNDLLTTGGPLGLGTLSFTFNELTASTLDTANPYTLISGASGVSGFTGGYATTFLNDTGAGYTAAYSLNGNNLQVQFTPIAAAPEPSQFAAFGIGLVGLGGLALRARRRTQIAA